MKIGVLNGRGQGRGQNTGRLYNIQGGNPTRVCVLISCYPMLKCWLTHNEITHISK